MKSVWPMEGRSAKDWSYFVTLVVGDSDGKYSWWGKTSTVRAWVKRGFATGDPGSCTPDQRPPPRWPDKAKRPGGSPVPALAER
jgi:hypothetical protein